MDIESDICFTTEYNESKIKNLLKRMDQKNTNDLAEVFQLLSDFTRLKILQALSLEELCVCEIAMVAGITQSAASHQLRRLKDARLVKKRRDGQKIYYFLYDQHIYDFLKVAFEHNKHLSHK